MEVPKFYTGDRVVFFPYGKGIVMGEVYWGWTFETSRFYWVLLDNGDVKDIKEGSLSHDAV